MKGITKYIAAQAVAIGLVFGASGCSDFFDVVDESSVSPDNFPTNLEHCDLLLNSAYAGSHGYGLYEFFWFPQIMYMLDKTHDTYGDYDTRTRILANDASTNCNILRDAYAAIMNWIQYSNAAIQGIDQYYTRASESELPTVDYMKGQALFLRGMAYWHSQIFFELESKPDALGFPIIDKVPESISQMSPQRASAADTWNFIIDTFREAATLLEGHNSDKTRATEWAAKGMLAKALMQARHPQDALPVLKDIIDNSGARLLDFDTYPISPAYHDPKGPIVAKNAAGDRVATGTVNRGSEAHIMVLALSEAITEPGEYTVEVPARNIILEGTDETRYNRSFTLAYKVEPFKPIENKGVSIKPAQGEVSALTAFTISFEDIQFVEVNGNFKARLISKASGEEVASAKVRYGARTWDADVELDTPVTEAGEYVLVCEENLFYDGMTDEDFPEYRFAYVVDGSGVIPYEPEVIYSDPEENVAVGQLDEIVLTFDNIDQAYQNREVLAGISALDASGNAVAACAFFYDPNTMSGNEIGIRLSEPVTASGTYTITLPRRAFTLGGNMSDARFSNATTLTYLVDSSLSIGSVAVDADVEVRYFDLQGRSLAAPARGQVVIRVAGGKASKIRY